MHTNDPNQSFSPTLEPSSDIAPNLIGLEAERGRPNDSRQNRDVVEFFDDSLDAELVHDAPGVQIDDHQRAARLGVARLQVFVEGEARKTPFPRFRQADNREGAEEGEPPQEAPDRTSPARACRRRRRRMTSIRRTS